MGSSPASRNSSALWVLAALFAMNLLNYVDRFILAAVLPPVQHSLHFEDSDAKAGFLSTIFFVSYAVFSPVMGWLGDRVTRKYLLALGVGVWSLATFGSGLAQTYGGMLLARSLLGVGEATYATLAPTLIADVFPRAQRNRALAVFYMAIPIGAALGYLLGGWIATHHQQLVLLPMLESGLESLTGQEFTPQSRGWRMAFFVVGLPGLVVALAALLIREPRRGATEDVQEGDLLRHEALPLDLRVYATLGRNRSYVYNTLAMAMFTFALGGLQWWVPKYLSIGQNAMPLKDANFGLGVVVAVSGLVATPFGAWLADRLAVKRPGAYFWMSGVSMLAAVPFVLAALVVALYTSQPFLIFGLILISVTLAFLNYGPSNAILVNVTAPRMRAAAFAVNIFLIHFLGDIPSPYLMGAVSDWTRNQGWVADPQHGLFWGLALTVPAMLLSGVFFCLGGPHLEKDQEAVGQALRSTT